MKEPEKGSTAEPELRNLLWEREPVLSFPLPRIALPTGAPRRVVRYYRKLEEAWLRRWEGEVYQRACAAAQEARSRSRPFEPWNAGLTAEVNCEEGRILVCWKAEECIGKGRCVLSRTDAWQLPGGLPELPIRGRRKK